MFGPITPINLPKERCGPFDKRCPALLLIAAILLCSIDAPLVAWTLDSESGEVPFTKFLPSDHGGGPYNVQLVEDSRGIIYISNEGGFLRYDGQIWSKLPPTGYASHGIAIQVDSKQRFWVGGTEYLGYYETQEGGSKKFVDLTLEFLTALGSTEWGMIWRIFPTKERIFIITNFHVVVYENGDWRVYQYDVRRRILPSLVEDIVYIHARGDGLYRFEGAEPDKVLPDQEDISSGIMAVLSSKDGHYRFGTLSNGIWKYDGEDLVQESPSPDPGHLSFGYLSLDDDTLLIAQSTGLFIQRRGGSARKINPGDIESVERIYRTTDGSIWGNTTESIIRIPPPFYTSFEISASDVKRYEGDLYITSQSGIQRFNGSKMDSLRSGWGSNPIERAGFLVYAGATTMNATQGRAIQSKASIKEFVATLHEDPWDEQIFYSTDSPEASRWRIDDTGLTRLSQTRDSDKVIGMLAQVAPNTSLYSAFGLDTGLLHWPKDNTKGDPVIETLDLSSLPENLRFASPIQMGKRALLGTSEGLFEFDLSTRGFLPIAALGESLGQSYNDLVTSPTHDGDGLFIYVRDTSYPAGYKIGILRYTETKGYQWTPIYLPGIYKLGSVRSLFHERQNEKEILWVAGEQQLFRYNITEPLTPPVLRTNITKIEETIDKTLFYNGHGPLPTKTNWSYPQRSLRFAFASPPSAIGQIGSQKRLIGFDDKWSDVDKINYWEFGNLTEGTYRFEVRAIDEFGRPGHVESFEFTILPPWYRTLAAVIALALATALIVSLGIRAWTVHLRNRNLELEVLINQRTSELEHSNQALRRANAVKQDFLANMSHEIRNPLNGILGISRILEKGEVTPERLSTLNACARHLNQMLGQVLDYSSIESGKVRIQAIPFDPLALIKDTFDMHQILAEEKGLSFTRTIEQTEYQWIGDPTLVKQIIVNLLSNAIKYTPEGKVHFRLRAEHQDNSVHATFEVEDTGPGIPTEQETLIFENFTRLDNYHNSGIGGTGLGLAIASELAKRMGGNLRLDRTYDHGARFILEISFKLSEIPAIQIAPVGSEDFKDLLRGQSILVADDVDFNRDISREFLESMGGNVETVEDGRKALQALESQRFEIAVLDINMPILSGIDVAEKIHFSKSSPKPLMIALTGQVDPRVRDEALAAGFGVFLEKPLDFSKLLDALKYAKPMKKEKRTTDLLSYLAQNDPQKAAKMEERFAQALAQEISELAEHIEAGNTRLAREALHKLRGLINLRKTEESERLLSGLSGRINDPKSKTHCLELCKELQNLFVNARG